MYFELLVLFLIFPFLIPEWRFRMIRRMKAQLQIVSLRWWNELLECNSSFQLSRVIK